jgi:hypothetical protein
MRGERYRGMVPLKKGGLTWYTDGSKINEGTGAGVYGMAWGKLCFGLRQYTNVFEDEVDATKASTDENIKKGYCDRKIYILSDSQTAIKVLDSC